MRLFLAAASLFVLLASASAQSIAPVPPRDSDHDGLPDALEHALLVQFQPHFLVSAHDCSLRPAEFRPLGLSPVVQAQNGVLYGQAFPHLSHSSPVDSSPGQPRQVELHYYHLWRADCGQLGHPLDAEHVSVLLQRTGPAASSGPAAWQALYWYAAAHEGTLCDDSQIAPAASLHAVLHGPQVWVSRGKHASFLSPALCAGGCGGDDCSQSTPLHPPAILNLGELAAPMNGATWARSPHWPLAVKMSRSDFFPSRIARARSLPAGGVAWANPGKRPLQAAILGGNSALDGAGTGMQATGAALDTANTHTGNALNTASAHTSSSLATAVHNVGHALHITQQKVDHALQPPNTPPAPQ